MMLCKKGESKRHHRTSRHSTPCAQASKGPFRKEYARWDYVDPAILGKSERTCNMWPRLPPLISYVSCAGWVVSLMPRPGNHRLPNCIARLLNRGQKGSPPVSRLRKNHIMWRYTKWHVRGKVRQEVLSKQLGEYFIWRRSDVLSDRGHKFNVP